MDAVVVEPGWKQNELCGANVSLPRCVKDIPDREHSSGFESGLQGGDEVDLSALLSNLSPEVLDIWRQPIPTTPPSPSRPARKLQQQSRLPDDIVQQLVFRYQSGSSVKQLAAEFGINRVTALEHLKRAGVSRRPHVRKLTDQQVHEAGRLYATGVSLIDVAKQLGVSASTISNEFSKAGLPIRPRRGWN